MEQINNFFDRIASPLNGLANWLLRLGLGIALFLHGYVKLPISDGFVCWLFSKGVPMAQTAAYFSAWVSIVAGLGLIIGALLITQM